MAVMSAEEVALTLHENTPFVGWQIVVMTAISPPESGRNPVAHHQNTDLTWDDGLWQLNSRWLGKALRRYGLPVPAIDEYTAMIYDPVQNAKWAYVMWKAAFDSAAGGWSAKAVAAYWTWTTYRKGLHMPWMSEAKAAALAVGVPL